MMRGSPAPRVVNAPSKKKAGTTTERIVKLLIIELAGWYLVPFAVFFLPIVKRFTVDLVHGRVSEFHFARLPRQKEIDVVGFSIGSFHIHAGEIFPAAEVL